MQRSDALGGIGKSLAAAEILHLQTVLPESAEIDCVSQKVLVVADQEGTHTDELVSLAQFVRVKQNLLRGLHAALAAALNGILLALLGPRVIKVVAAASGND